jgi:hypothetical protein
VGNEERKPHSPQTLITQEHTRILSVSTRRHCQRLHSPLVPRSVRINIKPNKYNPSGTILGVQCLKERKYPCLKSPANSMPTGGTPTASVTVSPLPAPAQLSPTKNKNEKRQGQTLTGRKNTGGNPAQPLPRARYPKNKLHLSRSNAPHRCRWFTPPHGALPRRSHRMR